MYVNSVPQDGTLVTLEFLEFAVCPSTEDPRGHSTLEDCLRWWNLISCAASTFSREKTGFSMVPVIRKGKDNNPSFNVAPESRAKVFVKKPCLVVIFASP